VNILSKVDRCRKFRRKLRSKESCVWKGCRECRWFDRGEPATKVGIGER